jgi:hypothetical protein
MKKILILAAMAMALVAIMGPAPAGAVEVKIGATGMYDWWDPPFKELHEGKSSSLFYGGLKHENDGSFMLGPELDLKWGSWRMQLLGLFGVTRNEFSYTDYMWDFTLWNFTTPRVQMANFNIGESKARRYDVDLKFGKSIIKYLYINFGARFNYAKGDGSQFIFYPSGGPLFNFGEYDYHYYQVGPLVGLGFEYEIKGFSIYADVNFLVNFGNNYLERKLLFPSLYPYLIPFKYDTDVVGFGFDTDIGVAYFIAPAHISVGLGFRWVGVVCVPGHDDSSMIDFGYRNSWVKNRWDHFYGITMNVSARF